MQILKLLAQFAHRPLPALRRVRQIGLAAALPVALLSVVILASGSGESLISQGPIQAGHADVGCIQCNLPAPGSIRQQMQQNVRYLVGATQNHADFGYQPVTSEGCLACHQRPNERHPIYRFREPRFQVAVGEINATTCLGCHSEHRDERVAVEPVFCKSCHAELTLKLDPLDVTHDQLIARKDWASCLGCHDFHGNHRAAVPIRRLDALKLDALLAYLKNGTDPYANEKIYQAVAK